MALAVVIDYGMLICYMQDMPYSPSLIADSTMCGYPLCMQWFSLLVGGREGGGDLWCDSSI